MRAICTGRRARNKPNTRRVRRARSTRGLHPEAQPEATCTSLGTHSTIKRVFVHLPCGGVPSSACHAAPRTLTVAGAAPSVPAVAVVGVLAAAAAAPGAAMEDTWAAAGTRGAGTCRGRTHKEGSTSSKASVADLSSSAGTSTAAHTHTPNTATATPPSSSAEHAERPERLKYGKARPKAVTESNVQNAEHA